jgi:hypothetical protein
LKGLNHFATLLPESQLPWGCGPVYGGTETQQRTGITIADYRHLHGLFSLAAE